MSKDIILRAKTMDTTSDAVVVSVGLISVDFTDDTDQFTTLYVKFDGREQVNKYKRTISQDTLAWWKKQDPLAYKNQVIPSDTDHTLLSGFNKIKQFVNEELDKDSVIWTRGGFEVMMFQHIATQLNSGTAFHWAKVRDTRTAIDLLAGSKNGFCNILKRYPEDLEPQDPVDDAIKDFYMLKYYVEAA